MRASLGLLASLALAVLPGCTQVLGIDGTYGDAPDTTMVTPTGDSGSAEGGDAAPDTHVGDDASPPPPDSGRGGEGDDDGSSHPPHDGGTIDASPNDAAADTGHASEAGDDSQSDSGTIVGANRHTIAFGPSADGSGAPAVFATRPDGSVMTWTFGPSMTATAAAGVPLATTLAGGTHVCVVALVDQSLWCWGTGAPTPAGAKPTQLPGTGTGQWTMRSVANGDAFTCILDSKGTVGCAGTLAGWTSPGGALSYPVFTGGMFASGQLFDASDLAAAGGAICVVNDLPLSGLYCWGDNTDLVAAPTGKAGQAQAYPWVVLSSPQDARTVSVSPSHACATYLQGGAGATHSVCWGADPESSGALQSWDPLSAQGAVSVVTTGVAGTEATFLVFGDGSVTAAGTWAANAHAGLLGGSYPQGSTSFVTIPELTGVVEIAASGTEACARLAGGGVTCWGNAGGNGNQAVAPTRVTGLP